MSHSPIFSQLPYLPRALALIWQAAPGLAAAWTALLLAQGLLPALTITLTRLLVDRLVLVLHGAPYPQIPWAALNPALLLAAGLALLMLAGQLLQSLTAWVHTAQVELVELRVCALIQQKASQADYALFEISDENDKLYRARVEAAYRPVAVLDSLGQLAQGTVTLAAMFALLLPYGPLPVLVLAASSLPILWVVVRYKQRQHAWLKTIASQERRAWYYDWLLTAQEAAAELRLFGAAPRFMQRYREIRTRLRADRLSLERHNLAGQLAAELIGLLAAGLCMANMAWRALQGLAALGDLVLFYQVISQGQSILRGLLQNLGQLYGSLLFLSNLFDFLDLPNTVADPEHPAALPPRFPDPASRGTDSAAPASPTIRIHDLTFTYPGSDRPALHHFNLEIPAGQIAAIVGDNGAGKSTLLKLLCRLYDPQSGQITWDGCDLRALAQQDLRSRITVLFQQPMQYQATVFENIGYSMNLDPGNPRAVTDIHKAAQAAGAHDFIKRLPRGYDTPLGKWFEHGTDLSVGEWQRIALARAFLRKSPLMLLDEPTSAMDAWAEAEWLDRLRRLAAGRTTLIITHRLTTAMQADIIHVMVAGQVAETGTHAELVALGGRYAQAWLAQTRERAEVVLSD